MTSFNYPQIIFQIKGLARSYIQRRDTLILVVAACNADLATTKALRLANEVDRDGERTIGKNNAHYYYLPFMGSYAT